MALVSGGGRRPRPPAPRGIANIRNETIRSMFAEYAEMRGLPLRPPSALPQLMQPDEVADVILFPVSAAASRVNGQAIGIG